MKCARQGAIGAVIFAVSYAAGALFLYFTATNPSTGGAVSTPEELVMGFIGIVLVALLIFFGAWRIFSGKGWLSAILVTILFVVESFAKIVSGTTNAVWIIVYVAVFSTLINGIRGCWWIRASARKAPHENLDSTTT